MDRQTDEPMSGWVGAEGLQSAYYLFLRENASYLRAVQLPEKPPYLSIKNKNKTENSPSV